MQESADLELIGNIIKCKANDIADVDMKAKLTEKGYAEENIKAALDLLDTDEFITIRTIPILAPINPIYYTIGEHKVTVEKRILWGLFKDSNDVGIRTIDNVSIEQRIISANLVVTHSGKQELHIEKITKSAAKKIGKFFGDVIESQRAKVINIAQD